MRTRYGNTWFMKTLPALTVEAFTPNGCVTAWRACFAGVPLPQITPGRNSRDVMQRAYNYFDRRVDL